MEDIFIWWEKLLRSDLWYLAANVSSPLRPNLLTVCKRMRPPHACKKEQVHLLILKKKKLEVIFWQKWRLISFIYAHPT